MNKTNWKKCKLGDVISIKHGFAFKGVFFSEISTPYILVTPGNFQIGGGFKDSKLKYYNGPIPQDYILKTGDVIVTMTDLSKVGDTLGYSALVPNLKGKTLLHNQRIGLVLSKNTLINKQFIYWLMREHNYQQYIVNTASGSTVKHTSPSRIEDFEFLLPPLEEQKRIAEILGSLDDKIELLQKQNKTLEDMAKALFKSWFVDFDVVRAKQKGRPKADIMREYHLTEELYDLFPSSFADSPLGPIPSGWEVKTLGDVVVCHDSKRIPLSNRERSEKQGPYPYYGATSIMDHVENYLFDGIFLLLGEDGSVVKPDGTPFLQYVFGKIWVNNHAHVLQGKGNIRTEYLYLFLSDVQIQPYVTGAVQAKLNQKNMNSIPLCVANEEIIKIFQGNIDIVFTKIRANLKQIQTLTELRDTLLPRLISGKIRV